VAVYGPSNHWNAQEWSLHRRGETLAAASSWSICWVQLGIRPWNDLWVEDEWTSIEHLDEPSRNGTMGVRSTPWARFARGRLSRCCHESKRMGLSERSKNIIVVYISHNKALASPFRLSQYNYASSYRAAPPSS
jgi:hypothetical protein